MIQTHQKRANMAAAVWIASLLGLLIVLPSVLQEGGTIYSVDHPATLAIFITHALSLIVACWFYAKSKGYYGIFGAFLGLASFIGLFILLALPDRR